MKYTTKSLIDHSRMTMLQYTTIGVCFFLNMLDGMDVSVMTYCAGPIGKAWNLSPVIMGSVFSSGLVGMTLGTLILAPLADKFGRKNIILLSGFIMGVFIFLTSYSQSVSQLITYRFFSGLGIGCMLASTAALGSEFVPEKSRNFWVSFLIAGYPVGAVITGLVAAEVIPTQGWQTMFTIAGVASMLSVPMILLFLSESIDYYLSTQPRNALSKVNVILGKMNIAPLNTLPELQKTTAKIPILGLLETTYRKPTLQLWLALFMSFATLYFLTSWIPKLATDAGLSVKLAIYAGTVFNLGAFLGIITQGFISIRLGLKKTLASFFIFTGVLMASFGIFIGSDIILVIFALLGFGIQGGFVGLYALAARLYPTEFRTTGVGWAMGAGRVGGIVSPQIAGILIGAGLGLTANFMIFAIPAVIAGIATYRIKADQID